MTVYVLRMSNLVKIGYTDDLRTRLSALKTTIPMPTELVGHMPGGREVEAHFHWTFAGHRVEGEWFVETPQMTAMFETLLIPSLPDAEPKPRDLKRVGSDEEVQRYAVAVREAAAKRWPSLPHGSRVSELATALGWNRNRAKDLYYADARIVLRGFETEALDRWLALLIAPELRGEE